MFSISVVVNELVCTVYTPHIRVKICRELRFHTPHTNFFSKTKQFIIITNLLFSSTLKLDSSFLLIIIINTRNTILDYLVINDKS